MSKLCQKLIEILLVTSKEEVGFNNAAEEVLGPPASDGGSDGGTAVSSSPVVALGEE